MMTANYHTHTRWCRHAEGEIEDYIKEGVAKGLKELAITEHVPHDNVDRRRIHLNEFEAFNAELDGLIKKYSAQIRIIKGLECEFFPDAVERYRHYRDVYGYKLLILGHHMSKDNSVDNFAASSPDELLLYADEVCEGLESGIFTFLAHPDVILSAYDKWDEYCEIAMNKIFATCEKLDIPVEINANGKRDGRRYPDINAWRLSKKFKLRYIINSDAHSVHHLVDGGVVQCEDMARELGLEIMESLKI